MLTLPDQATPENRILWDVVEDHFNESAYEFGRWGAALRSPRYLLREVADGPEESLCAHLQGVLLAGEAGFERMVLPHLQCPPEDEPAMLAVAGALALRSGNRPHLVPLLWEGEAVQRQAIIQGLRLCDDAGFDAWSIDIFRRGFMAESPRIAMLELAADRGLNLGALEASLVSASAAEASIAAKAAAWSERRLHLPMLEDLLSHPALEVRLAALETALVWGSKRAWRCCLDLVEAHASEALELLDFVAILGGPEQHSLLARLFSASHERTLYAAIRASGLSGNVGFVTALLGHVRAADPLASRLAGEAIALLTGFPADQTKHHREAPVLSEEEEARLALPELEDEDLDADLGHQEEEELPYLDAESVASWWRARMDTSDSTRPTLLGQPISSEICLTALHSGSMRRRRALARRIWIGSGGRATIAVDRPTSYQCSNLSRLATTDLVSGNSLAAWR